MGRKKISDPVALKILYDSAYVCAICQSSGGQIHHIDGNNSNNAEENLIFVCIKHHDEAHSTSTMTRNLGPAELKHAKDHWCSIVQERRALTSTMIGQLELCGDSEFSKIGLTWGHINHRRVAEIGNQVPRSEKTMQLLSLCEARGLVDANGIMIEPSDYLPNSSFVYNAIYDRFQHGDDSRFHQLYASIVDDISNAVSPVHLEPDQWSKLNVEALIKSGSFVYVQHRFYFKSITADQLNEHRRVHYTKNKIRIEFYVDSFDMFGTTSMTVSFAGANTCSAFLQVKSIDKNGVDGLLLKCTPIALGVGFSST